MSEPFLGHVRDGAIVVEGPLPWVDGTQVRIAPIEAQVPLKALSELLLAVAGKATGLPSDLAAQHDHYLHGQPKR